MRIETVSVNNFRNIAADEVVFPPASLLVAAAPNATGKTNFLEALVFLLRGKSFRATAEECVRWGSDSFLVRGNVNAGGATNTIAVQYHTPSRKLRIEEGGAPASPVTFFSRYPFVLFLPEDTFLFIRGPAQRRTFLNHLLMSSPSYLSALVQYYRALKQRNALLKRAATPEALAAWTELLVEHAGPLWQQRQGVAQFLHTHLAHVYQTISGEERDFSVVLQTGDTAPAHYRDTLAAAFGQERRYGYTLHGPHRDDLEIMTGTHPIRVALSRGQLRSVAIALKLIAHRFITTTVGEEPILLLDEVLSELDEQRQATLLEQLPATQTILTCTAVPATLRRRSDVHALDIGVITVPSLPAPVPALAAVAA